MGQEGCPGGPRKLAGSSESLLSLSGQGHQKMLWTSNARAIPGPAA